MLNVLYWILLIPGVTVGLAGLIFVAVNPGAWFFGLLVYLGGTFAVFGACGLSVLLRYQQLQ